MKARLSGPGHHLIVGMLGGFESPPTRWDVLVVVVGFEGGWGTRWSRRSLAYRVAGFAAVGAGQGGDWG